MAVTHAAWACWTIFSPDTMATRGYSNYRGRNKGKVPLIIGLAAILLAAIGFLVIQNYLIYDDAGKAHWELPFMEKRQDPEPAIDPDDVDIQREEPASTVGKELTTMQAKELPMWCLSDDPVWLLSDAPKGVVVNVKNVDGSLSYASAVTVPEEIGKGGEWTLPNLRTILDSDHDTVARMACLRDNSYPYAMTEQAALCQENGSLWWDYYGRCWLDPAKAGTLDYVKSLCQEYVTLGFDEIMLDYFGYPTDWTGQAERSAVLTAFMNALRQVLPEGTRISLMLHELPSAENGLTAELLNTAFDRIYTDSDMDITALKAMLPEGFDANTRLVPTVWQAAESGSYMISAD